MALDGVKKSVIGGGICLQAYHPENIPVSLNCPINLETRQLQCVQVSGHTSTVSEVTVLAAAQVITCSSLQGSTRGSPHHQQSLICLLVTALALARQMGRISHILWLPAGSSQNLWLQAFCSAALHMRVHMHVHTLGILYHLQPSLILLPFHSMELCQWSEHCML